MSILSCAPHFWSLPLSDITWFIEGIIVYSSQRTEMLPFADHVA